MIWRNPADEMPLLDEFVVCIVSGEDGDGVSYIHTPVVGCYDKEWQFEDYNEPEFKVEAWAYIPAYPEWIKED